MSALDRAVVELCDALNAANPVATADGLRYKMAVAYAIVRLVNAVVQEAKRPPEPVKVESERGAIVNWLMKRANEERQLVNDFPRALAREHALYGAAVDIRDGLHLKPRFDVPGHRANNPECPLNNPEALINPAFAGLRCNCS